MASNSTIIESDNNANQYGLGSLDQYNWLEPIAKNKLIAAIIAEIVGDKLSNCHEKNATTKPATPAHNPDFQKRRTPRCA